MAMCFNRWPGIRMIRKTVYSEGGTLGLALWWPTVGKTCLAWMNDFSSHLTIITHNVYGVQLYFRFITVSSLSFDSIVELIIFIVYAHISRFEVNRRIRANADRSKVNMINTIYLNYALSLWVELLWPAFEIFLNDFPDSNLHHHCNHISIKRCHLLLLNGLIHRHIIVMSSSCSYWEARNKYWNSAMSLIRGSQNLRKIKPIFSADRDEARHRVVSLYKAWYRQIPFIGESRSRWKQFRIIRFTIIRFTWFCK